MLSLVSSRSPAAQSRGMAALAQLAHNNHDNQDAMAKMGGIRPLVQLLESSGSDSEVAAYAASALMEISRDNAANQQSVVESGGVAQLATIMKSSSNAEVKAEVAGALWALSADPAIKVAIASNHTIPPLVQLLGTGDERACEHAASALASLGRDNSENQVQITHMLIELLINGSDSAQERAVHALNEVRAWRLRGWGGGRGCWWWWC